MNFPINVHPHDAAGARTGLDPNPTPGCKSEQRSGRHSEQQGNASLPLANFDHIARLYRWLEYLTLGPILQQTRTHFLPRLHDRRQILLFGDGDGRFLARMIDQSSHLAADAVDTSAMMLSLLVRRAESIILSPSKDARSFSLSTHNQSALTYIPTHSPDLVVTHFFLDCLNQTDLEYFVPRLAPTLAPEALWLVSEFQIPSGILRLPGRIFIRALYFAFRLLTGLRVTHLPDHHSVLTASGFVRIASHQRLFGLLIAELWQNASSQ